MASIKSFADFNLDDILISEDYKAVDSADEEDLDNTADADPDVDASVVEPDYENDFEEQSEYAGSPQMAVKYDAQKLNAFGGSGGDDTYNENYEDDYHDTSTMIQDGDDEQQQVASVPAAATSDSTAAAPVPVSTVQIVSPDTHNWEMKSAGSSVPIQQAPVPIQQAPVPTLAAAAAPTQAAPIQAVNTEHKGIVREFTDDYFLNTSVDMDVDVGARGESGSGPDTAVNMKSMPSKMRPNYSSTFSPPPASPSLRSHMPASSESPPPAGIVRTSTGSVGRSTVPSSTATSLDRSTDATSIALRNIAANSTSISRRNKDATRGPMAPKVSRVHVTKMDSALQDMVDKDVAKKEKVRRLATRGARGTVRVSHTSAPLTTNPAAHEPSPRSGYTAEKLLRAAIRKDSKARIRAVNATPDPVGGLPRDLLALVGELVDARVVQRLGEAENKRQFLSGVSRQAVLVPSSSAGPATTMLPTAATEGGSALVSAADPDLQYQLEYQQQLASLRRNRAGVGARPDMTYRNSYDFTTVTSPRASVDTECRALAQESGVSQPNPAPAPAVVSDATTTQATTPASDQGTPHPSASLEALERYGGAAEAIYAGFLKDVISTCKERASSSRTPQEMVMHRCLAERLFSHFGDNNAVIQYRNAMAASADACGKKIDIK